MLALACGYSYALSGRRLSCTCRCRILGRGHERLLDWGSTCGYHTRMESWFSQHQWINSARAADASTCVYHVSPHRWVLLPKSDPPQDLVDFLSKAALPLVPGKSASVVTMEAGLHPKWTDHVAIIGKKAGFWDLWPKWNSFLWKHDVGSQYPMLVETF